MRTIPLYLAVVSCCLGTLLISGNGWGQDPESPEPTKTKLFRSNKYISQLVGEEFTPEQKAEGVSVRYTAAVMDKDGNPIAQKGPTDTDLARLGEIPNLEYLVVYGDAITERGFANLPTARSSRILNIVV
jgi:hypothetical protein